MCATLIHTLTWSRGRSALVPCPPLLLPKNECDRKKPFSVQQSQNGLHLFRSIFFYNPTPVNHVNDLKDLDKPGINLRGYCNKWEIRPHLLLSN